MAVASMTSMLISQIETALSMGPAANPKVIAQIIAAAVGSMAGVGKLPAGPALIPIIPAGISIGASQIETALNLGPAAKPKIVAQLIALGISSIGVNAPPAGLSFLASQIESSFSLGPAANEKAVANIIGSSVPTYYNMGGVI